MEEAVFSASSRKAWHRDRKKCALRQLAVAFPQPAQSFAEANVDYSRLRHERVASSRDLTQTSSEGGKRGLRRSSAQLRCE
jgi:hypothetical protein